MKNWITQVVAGLFAVAALASCEKDEEKATITPSNAITLSTSANRVVLTQANQAQTAASFTWTPVTFAPSSNTPADVPAVSYRLQLAKTETGFGNAAVIDAGTKPTLGVLVGSLNTTLLGLGLAPDQAASVYVRVAAVVGTDAKSFVSNPVMLTVTPYKECLPPNSDSWGLVGPAGNGWPGPTDTDLALTWNCDAKAYMLRTTLNAGDYKFRLNKQWTVNLGALTKPITPGVAPTTLKLGGEDMTVTTPGTYTVKLEVTGSGANVTAGKLTVTP